MKEFLFLFRGGDSREIQHDADKWKMHMDRWMTWMGELAQKKQFVSAQPLTDTGKMISGTKKIVSDGPYLEGKEFVGGYLVCLAENYEAAVAIAQSCPLLEFEDGVVEVREVKIAEQLNDLKA